MTVAVLVSAACGSNDSPSGSGGYVHPTGDDEVVVEYAEVGGFTTFVRGFQSPPPVLVSGGGELITPGAVVAIYPGPLLPVFERRTITEAGIQSVLAAADEAGLMRDVEYEDDPRIADASTSVVTVAADENEWIHAASALGIFAPEQEAIDVGSGVEADEQEDRGALAEFIGQLLAIEELVGAEELGDSLLYEATAYLLVARPVSAPGSVSEGDIEPTVVPWPDATGVVLADAGQCTEAGANAVGDLFETSNELTLFEEDGVVYEVAPIQKLPGRSC
jgi:hypothetical protein